MKISDVITQLQLHLKDSGDIEVRIEPAEYRGSVEVNHITLNAYSDGSKDVVLEEL